MTTRFDSVPIRDFDIDEQTKFLNVRRVPIAQVMVQPYRRSDGSIEMEAKLPDQLLSDATVASANNKPVTNDHPDELVTSSNAQTYAKGFTTSNAHVEGNTLYNDITIMDSDLIDAIQNGKHELSIGFETKVVPEPGELNGIKYDSVQKDIRINHVAVVDRGRAGHNIRLLGDSAVAVGDYTNEGESMETTKVRVDGADVTVAVSDADKITKLDADNNAKAKEIDDLNAKIGKLTAERDSLKGEARAAQDKADSVSKENEELKSKYEGDFFAEKVEKAMQDRLELIDTVKPYLADSYDFKGKDEKQLKLDAIKEKTGTDLSDEPLAVIKGYFKRLKEESDKPVVAGISDNTTSTMTDSNDELAAIRARRLNMYQGGNK